MEDEIDLRKYVRVLFQHWKLIAGLTVAGAAAALVLALALPRSYEASALVVVTSPRFILNFEPRIETAAGQDKVEIDPKAYLGLATSDELLTQLLADPATASLEEGERTREGLLGKLEATTGTDPTLIELRATGDDPERAAAIANAWARLFVKYVNQLYGYEQDTQARFGDQLSQAKADYEVAQRAVEKFLADNRLAELQREMDARQTLINSYQSELTASRGQSLPEQLQARRQTLDNAYDELISLEQQQRQIIQDYYGDLAAVESLLVDARALREQVQASSVSSAASLGDALAQLFLRSRSLASGAGGNVQLQLSFGQGAGPIPVSDVDSLIDVLESRKAQTQAQIEALLAVSRGQAPDPEVEVDSRFGVLEARKAEIRARIEALTAELLAGFQVPVESAPNDPVSQLIAQYSDEVLTLNAELEAEEARQRELTQARDLAWETYTSLTRKAEERRIAVQTGEAIVRLASAASTPLEPAVSVLVIVAAAGIASLMVGVLTVILKDWWQGVEAEAIPSSAALDIPPPLAESPLAGESSYAAGTAPAQTGD